MSNLDAAVEYHRKGFSVIPIKTGTKKALVPWESYQAQPASEATLTHWFTSWPDANVGLVTGAVSDCVVIDLDSTEAKDALKRLAPDYNFSSAPRVRTGKGGYHLFFKHPGVSIKTRVAVLPKMDVRADGGYVVAAPSIHGETGKRYAWEVPLNGHLPELPGELLKLISSPASGATRSSGNIAEGGIEQGQRNATLTSLAGTMRRRAMSESSILAALQEENRTRCNPPLPEHEVEVIARSVSRYVAGDIREQVTPSANKNEGLSVPVPDENPESEFPETAFPAAAWTGLFAQWRDMIGSRTEAPTEYLWGAFLVAAGAMIGRSAWRDSPRPLFPNFYLLLTGRTGDSRKSTALWFAEQLLQNVGEDVETIHGIVSTEGLIERLAKREATKGLGYADEFRSLLSVAKRKGTQDILPRLNSLYYCPDSETVDRRENPTAAVRPFFSLIAATPEEFVADLLGELEITGGFLNRFLIIPGEEQPPKPIVTRPSPEEWADLVSPMRRIRDEITSRPHRMEFDQRASALWNEFYIEWRNSRKAWHAKMASLSARTFEHVLKISVVYSVLASEPAISAKSLATAILIGNWLQSNTLRIFGDAGLDQFGRTERTILAILRKSKTGAMYRRDLQQAAFKKGFNGELFGRALKSLEANEHINIAPVTSPAGHTRPVVRLIRQQVTQKANDGASQGYQQEGNHSREISI